MILRRASYHLVILRRARNLFETPPLLCQKWAIIQVKNNKNEEYRDITFPIPFHNPNNVTSETFLTSIQNLIGREGEEVIREKEIETKEFNLI